MALTINPPEAPLVYENRNVTKEWYRFFARLQKILGNDVIQSLQEAFVVTYGDSEIFGNQRILSAGTGLDLAVDLLNVIISLADTAVAPALYGSASRTPSFVVDQQGRLTFAEDFELNSDNVIEGIIHLFFTVARARGAISGVGGISYNSGTGAIDTVGFTGTVGPVTFSKGVAASGTAVAGFSGTGAYTSFTFVNGICTAAS